MTSPKPRSGTRSKQVPPPLPPGVDLLDCGRLIWPEELAPYVGVPLGTLDQWASRGGGPSFHRVGMHRRYHPADVRSWLAKCRRAVTGDPRPAA